MKNYELCNLADVLVNPMAPIAYSTVDDQQAYLIFKLLRELKRQMAIQQEQVNVLVLETKPAFLENGQLAIEDTQSEKFLGLYNALLNDEVEIALPRLSWASLRALQRENPQLTAPAFELLADWLLEDDNESEER